MGSYSNKDYMKPFNRLFSITIAILEFLRSMIKYDIICRRRNSHRPNEKDLESFLNDMEFKKETVCLDCGFLLEIEQDEHDRKSYWIYEI